MFTIISFWCFIFDVYVLLYLQFTDCLPMELGDFYHFLIYWLYHNCFFNYSCWFGGSVANLYSNFLLPLFYYVLMYYYLLYPSFALSIVPIMFFNLLRCYSSRRFYFILRLFDYGLTAILFYFETVWLWNVLMYYYLLYPSFCSIHCSDNVF